MTTQMLLKSLLGGDKNDSREILAKLRLFCKEWDEFSEQQWSGYILKAFMEHTSGFMIDYRTFSRWKRISGIVADKQRYGHGSFVLATAIAQMKKEGRKVVTPKDVLIRVGEIDPKLGMAVWAKDVVGSQESDSKEPRILGVKLPEKVKQINGIQRSEHFYRRNLPGYKRSRPYTASEVMSIAIGVQKYVSSIGTNGSKRKNREKRT